MLPWCAHGAWARTANLCREPRDSIPRSHIRPRVAQMAGLSEYAVDGMLPLLFKQFEEHRWQTKLGAVKMFTELAASSTKCAPAAATAPAQRLRKGDVKTAVPQRLSTPHNTLTTPHAALPLPNTAP